MGYRTDKGKYHLKRRELVNQIKSEIMIINEDYRYNNQNISYVIKSKLGTFVGTAKFTEGDDYKEEVGKNLAKTRAYRLYNMEVGVHIENNYIIALTKQMNHYKRQSQDFKEKEHRIQASIDRYYERKNK